MAPLFDKFTQNCYFTLTVARCLISSATVVIGALTTPLLFDKFTHNCCFIFLSGRCCLISSPTAIICPTTMILLFHMSAQCYSLTINNDAGRSDKRGKSALRGGSRGLSANPWRPVIGKSFENNSDIPAVRWRLLASRPSDEERKDLSNRFLKCWYLCGTIILVK